MLRKSQEFVNVLHVKASVWILHIAAFNLRFPEIVPKSWTSYVSYAILMSSSYHRGQKYQVLHHSIFLLQLKPNRSFTVHINNPKIICICISDNNCLLIVLIFLRKEEDTYKFQSNLVLQETCIFPEIHTRHFKSNDMYFSVFTQCI